LLGPSEYSPGELGEEGKKYFGEYQRDRREKKYSSAQKNWSNQKDGQKKKRKEGHAEIRKGSIDPKNLRGAGPIIKSPKKVLGIAAGKMRREKKRDGGKKSTLRERRHQDEADRGRPSF